MRHSLRHLTCACALLAAVAAPLRAADEPDAKPLDKHHQEELAKYDTNHDGKLDDGERLALIADRSAKLKEKHPELFAKIDTNGDGKISLEEWKAAQPMLEEMKKKHEERKDK